MMNWRGIWTIVRKDLMMVVRSKAVLMPILLVPLIIIVLLPVGASLMFSNEAVIRDTAQDAAGFLENMPANVQTELAQFEGDAQRWLYLFLAYLFAPMFLILPIMVANVIAADSFVGEKERKTIEALIYTPLTDTEIYIGKMLTAWIPGILVSLVSGVVFCIVANVAAWPIMGQIFLPNATWVGLIVWLSPAVAGLGLAAMVLVSSRVRTFQEASQMGGMIVIPVILLMGSQFAGVIYLSPTAVIIMGVIVWVLDFALLWYGARSFQRGEIIAQL